MLALVAALGLGLGSIKIRGIGLGAAGVLFAGILFGHFGLEPTPEVLDFCRDFGLILFVYAIGVQVGPGFFNSLRRDGLRLNLLAASVVIMGAILTIGITQFAGIPMAVGVGMFSGATTNTPSLGAAQEALQQVAADQPELSAMPALAYAVSYPFGILGIILTMLVLRTLFQVRVEEEQKALDAVEPRAPPPHRINLELTNENLAGLCLSKIPTLENSSVVISRLKRGEKVVIARPDNILQRGDILLAVGPREELDQLRLVVGKESDDNVMQTPSELITRRIVVTQRSISGKSLDELDLLEKFGVTITRVSRAEIEMTANPRMRLQFGDLVLAVGEDSAVAKVADLLGDSPKQLDHPEVVPVFIGIALGILVGSIPFAIPGMPAAVKLGLAGGPLLVAIILSRVGRIGPVLWHLPISANFMLREIGIILFLACVGIKSGGEFFAILADGDGLKWMGYAALITVIPIFLAGIFARIFLKTNFLPLCGLLAGSMTDPPALAFAGSVTKSEAPSLAYASVYPLTMILRVFCAQVLVFFFVT